MKLFFGFIALAGGTLLGPGSRKESYFRATEKDVNALIQNGTDFFRALHENNDNMAVLFVNAIETFLNYGSPRREEHLIERFLIAFTNILPQVAHENSKKVADLIYKAIKSTLIHSNLDSKSLYNVDETTLANAKNELINWNRKWILHASQQEREKHLYNFLKKFQYDMAQFQLHLIEGVADTDKKTEISQHKDIIHRLIAACEKILVKELGMKHLKGEKLHLFIFILFGDGFNNAMWKGHIEEAQFYLQSIECFLDLVPNEKNTLLERFLNALTAALSLNFEESGSGSIKVVRLLIKAVDNLTEFSNSDRKLSQSLLENAKKALSKWVLTAPKEEQLEWLLLVGDRVRAAMKKRTSEKASFYLQSIEDVFHLVPNEKNTLLERFLNALTAALSENYTAISLESLKKVADFIYKAIETTLVPSDFNDNALYNVDEATLANAKNEVMNWQRKWILHASQEEREEYLLELVCYFECNMHPWCDIYRFRGLKGSRLELSKFQLQLIEIFAYPNALKDIPGKNDLLQRYVAACDALSKQPLEMVLLKTKLARRNQWLK